MIDQGQSECVLRPRGDLDLASVDGVLNDWLETIDHDRPRTVTVDLTAVAVIDGSGLRMLRFLDQRLHARGILCRLRGATARQRELIDLVGLGQVFPDAGQPADSTGVTR